MTGVGEPAADAFFDAPAEWPAGAPAPPADVVVVSDFQPGPDATFTPRTLLFLASWIDNAGAARDWPLHLVCIGEPPEVVRRLAARAGARVTTAAPWPYEGRGTMNKLRGLEVDGETDRVLLLDADVVVLGDPSAITTLGDGLALAPCIVPRVPLTVWRDLFETLDVPLPDARIPCVQSELGDLPTHKQLYAEQLEEMPAMLPYYNAGVILAPRDAGLLAVWNDFVMRTRDHLGEEAWLKLVDGDQTALTPAVEVLRARGTGLARLPYALHAHDMVLYAGALRAKDVKLFHAFGLFRRLADRGLDVAGGWKAWRRRLFRFYRQHGWKPAPAGAGGRDDPIEAELRRLWRRLRRPWRAHVEPLLGRTAPPDGHRTAASG